MPIETLKRILYDISILSKKVARLETLENKFVGYVFVPLTSPLTSTSWDGDSFSTTAPTLIDLSAVFGVPAGVKAVYLSVVINDSGSAATADVNISFYPASGGIFAHVVYCGGIANDAMAAAQGIVPCDANGDVYYSITASGVGTLDVRIRIFGYWI
ncbi:MAG: hypothetical protein Q7N50_08335 [Armatimonadota bacterium]|nr:hypothetical protein [Armatimonadota bacterium]